MSTSGSSSSSWQDRRGMFQNGKEVHEPARKMSGTGVMDAVRRASVSSNSDAPKAIEPGQPARRRPSGVENLSQLKRGSQDYGERRSSHSEMQAPGGLVAGWFNKTFKGAGGSISPEQPQKEPRRGVME